MGPRLSARTLIAYNCADAGLGNRVRVVLGCRVLAEYEQRRFCYVWPTGPRFEPRLTDLWHFRGGLRTARSVSRVLARVFPYQEADATRSEGPHGGPMVRQIRTGGEIRLPDGARSWRADLRSLQPVSWIRETVRSFHAEHLADSAYVGVQIRAHAVSHQVTKDSSPVDWYLDRMSEIVGHHPGIRFFVSCDVPEVFDRVTRTIPGCVGVPDKGPYNSTTAVRAAVADLYLLAGAGHMLGPYGSSFVHLAENLSGDLLGLETARSPGSGPVDVAALGLVDDPLTPAIRRPAPGA